MMEQKKTGRSVLRMAAPIALAHLLGLVGGCMGDLAAPEISAEVIGYDESPVVWGAADERRDYYEAPADQGALARSSVGVMLPASGIDRRLGRGSARVRTRRVRGFCPSERFIDQPQVGDCSGTLIDGHLFATAGHCMGVNARTRSNGRDVDASEVQEVLRRKCAETAVLFNHLATGPTSTAEIVDARDVYFCHEVLVHSLVTSLSGGVVENAFDITIFSLKRSPSGSSAEPVYQPHGAAPVLSNPRQPPFSSGTRGIELLGIGSPEGMPLKGKTGELSLAEGDFWATSLLDVAQGDSGGGLFMRAGSGWSHIGVASQFRLSRLHCLDGEETRDHYCAQNPGGSDECLVEGRQRSPAPTEFTRHSLTHKAIDVLCGGAPPQGMLDLYPGAFPTYLCSGGSPIPAAPFDESVTAPEPTMPSEGSSSRGGGCSVGSSPNTAGALGFLFLGFLFLLRRARRAGAATWVALALFAMACEPDLQAAPMPEESPQVPDEHLMHVVSRLTLPRTADSLGFDLDGDEEVDAALGGLVETMQRVGIDLGEYVRAAVQEGRIQVLLDSNATDGELTIETYRGVGQEPLDDTGNANYEREPAPSGVLVGRIDPDRHVTAQSVGSVELAVRLMDDPEGPTLRIPISAARFEGEVGSYMAEGVFGGAVRVTSLADGVLAPMAAYMNRLVADDEGCPERCARISLQLALDLLDANDDHVIEVQEIESFPAVRDQLAPDLDLDGDGSLDAISVGLGIGAVQISSFFE